MTVEFRFVTFVAASPDRVFDFSRDIDVHQASMAQSRERAIAGRTSGLIELGETVTWRIVQFGIPLRMTSIISDMDRPHRFVDEQLHGPFQSFRHEHRFTSVPGGTEMVDEISFTAPLGILGRLAERVALERILRRFISDRNRHLAELAAR